MATDREEIVKQVRTEILREMEDQRGEFTVEDFSARLKEFSLTSSRSAAWKIDIKYDTASGSIQHARSSWKIYGGYDTSGSPKLANIGDGSSE